MADVQEGFLCPICLEDLGDLIQLQVHFEEKHTKDTDLLQNIKDLFGKAKKKIGVGNEEDALLALASEFSAQDQIFQPVQASFDPVSGIHLSLTERQAPLNKIQAVNLNEFFKTERSKRADMKAMDTNKLILRLERLLTSLPVDPVKRRAHEQSVVTWLPEESVKLCPNCAKSFNITRRKHHCRLCGAIMCSDCSDVVSFDLANRLIRPATIAKFSPDQEESGTKRKSSTPKKGYEHLVSNLVDLAGYSESQSNFKSCCYCKEVLDRRDACVQSVTQPPTRLVTFYNQLQKFITEAETNSHRYRDLATSLNCGEGTLEDLSEAKNLRLKILKFAEIIEATSKKILTLESDDDEAPVVYSLRGRIRTSAVNFIKESLIGLPSVPSEEELETLKKNRRVEAEKRIAEEKLKAQEAKIKYEQHQLSLQNSPAQNLGADGPVKKFLTPSPSANNLDAVKAQISNAVDGFRQRTTLGPRMSLFGSAQSSPPVKDVPVVYGSGFVATASEAGGKDLDPLVQQMHNLRQFISQARSVGKTDDAKLLEQNLRDLQDEYQKVQEQRELEDNYVNFKSVFGIQSPRNEVEPDDLQRDEELLDKSNPFAVEDLSHQVDFDEYDKSGKNPFF